MTKKSIDTLIKHIRQAGIVTKTSPWMIEGHGKQDLYVRHVGLRPFADWTSIMSQENNLLLKFILHKPAAHLEFYLANQPPFIRITSTVLSESDKWEKILGELKRRLKKDKEATLHHREQVGNLYQLIKEHLR